MSVIEMIKTIVSLAATCIGLLIIIVGLKYTVDIFQLVFSILTSPVILNDLILQLAASIGGTAFDLNIGGKAVPLANIMALMAYCGGMVVVAWLTLALMQTGARIVSFTAGDRRAVTQILQSAFGRSMKPKDKNVEKRLNPHQTGR